VTRIFKASRRMIASGLPSAAKTVVEHLSEIGDQSGP
jgi:hypothetical protein